MENELNAYASYFSSYLLNNLSRSGIRSIILFGSVARGEATKGSDVDIFIEVKKNEKKLEKKIKKLVDDFYKSKDALLFKNKGIDNKINVVVGKLNDWKELRDSIESTGVLLYGPYISNEIRGKKHVVISWDRIGKNRGAFLNKIYGFSFRNKRYKGMIEEMNGKKIGKSSILIPIEHRKEIFDLIKKYKVEARVFEVWGDVNVG